MEERQRHRRDDEPARGVFLRWPAAVALLAIGALYAVLSDGLTLGPRAFLLGLVAVLLVPLITAHLRGSHRLARWLGLAMVGLVTAAVVVSAFSLVSSALGGGTSAPALLRDAALLWIINVATFAVWYWEVDGGGPVLRRRKEYRSDDFLFPQTNVPTAAARTWHPEGGPGRIINVSSVHEDQAMPKNAPYCAAEVGLRMLTRTIALELAPMPSPSTMSPPVR